MTILSWINYKIATYFLLLTLGQISIDQFLQNINFILLSMKRHIFTIRNIQDHVCLHLSKCAKVKITHLVIFTASEFLPPHHISCIWFWWNISVGRNYIHTHRQYHFSFFSSFVFLQMFINIGSGIILNEHAFVLRVHEYFWRFL